MELEDETIARQRLADVTNTPSPKADLQKAMEIEKCYGGTGHMKGESTLTRPSVLYSNGSENLCTDFAAVQSSIPRPHRRSLIPQPCRILTSQKLSSCFLMPDAHQYRPENEHINKPQTQTSAVDGQSIAVTATEYAVLPVHSASEATSLAMHPSGHAASQVCHSVAENHVALSHPSNHSVARTHSSAALRPTGHSAAKARPSAVVRPIGHAIDLAHTATTFAPLGTQAAIPEQPSATARSVDRATRPARPSVAARSAGRAATTARPYPAARSTNRATMLARPSVAARSTNRATMLARPSVAARSAEHATMPARPSVAARSADRATMPARPSAGRAATTVRSSAAVHSAGRASTLAPPSVAVRSANHATMLARPSVAARSADRATMPVRPSGAACSAEHATMPVRPSVAARSADHATMPARPSVAAPCAGRAATTVRSSAAVRSAGRATTLAPPSVAVHSTNRAATPVRPSVAVRSAGRATTLVPPSVAACSSVVRLSAARPSAAQHPARQANPTCSVTSHVSPFAASQRVQAKSSSSHLIISQIKETSISQATVTASPCPMQADVTTLIALHHKSTFASQVHTRKSTVQAHQSSVFSKEMGTKRLQLTQRLAAQQHSCRRLSTLKTTPRHNPPQLSNSQIYTTWDTTPPRIQDSSVEAENAVQCEVKLQNKDEQHALLNETYDKNEPCATRPGGEAAPEISPQVGAAFSSDAVGGQTYVDDVSISDITEWLHHPLELKPPSRGSSSPNCPTPSRNEQHDWKPEELGGAVWKTCLQQRACLQPLKEEDEVEHKADKVASEDEEHKADKAASEDEEHKADKAASEDEEHKADKAASEDEEHKAASEDEEHKADKVASEDEEHKADKAASEDEEHKADKAASEDEEHKADKAASEDEEHKADKAASEDEEHKADKAASEDEEHKADKAALEDEEHKADKAASEDQSVSEEEAVKSSPEGRVLMYEVMSTPQLRQSLRRISKLGGKACTGDVVMVTPVRRSQRLASRSSNLWPNIKLVSSINNVAFAGDKNTVVCRQNPAL